MKKLACLAVAAFTLAVILTVSVSAFAANFVNSAVFSITSTATTSTTNLRVIPMGPKVAPRTPDGNEILQTYLWQANQAQNLFLTKTKTVDLSSALCVWVQVDQDTKVKVNSETAYMVLPSGYNNTICFK